jgi:amino acid transporter
MDDILGGLTALLVFIGLSMPFIILGLVYYFKKRLEHKQILAAIEKGMPVSELNIRKAKEDDKTTGPGWVKDITKGITCLIIAVGVSVVFFYFLRVGPIQAVILLIIPIIFFANGVGLVIRGMMRKKYEKQSEERPDENTSNEPPLPAEG